MSRSDNFGPFANEMIDVGYGLSLACKIQNCNIKLIKEYNHI